MADPHIDLFCEDSGHELFARSLITRVARDIGLRAKIDARSVRGGHGRALTELEAYQRAIRKGFLRHPIPDLLVVVVDANDLGPAKTEQLIRERIDPAVFPRVVIGIPDPHVERWCFADPEAFVAVVGAPPPGESLFTTREDCKALFRRTILEAGQTIATDAMEYAPDLIARMDLYRAGKNQPSLKRLIDALRAGLTQVAGKGS